MPAGRFGLGHLDMSPKALDPVAIAIEWRDYPINRIACIVAIILWLILLSEYIGILPSLKYCFQRAKGSVSLEHSLSQSRNRNMLAVAMFLPFCLLVDRYQLFSPSWWGVIQADYSLMFTTAVLLAFILFRLIVTCFPLPKKLKGEEKTGVRGVIFNIFLLAVPVMLATAGIAELINLPDKAVRIVIYVEACLSLLLTIAREIEILRFHCSGFSTFLYLCALEILPDGMLIFESLR